MKLEQTLAGMKEMEFKRHIVGDWYTIFYGKRKGYFGGAFDARECLVVHGDGYSYRGNHFWGYDNWFMFPS